MGGSRLDSRYSTDFYNTPKHYFLPPHSFGTMRLSMSPTKTTSRPRPSPVSKDQKQVTFELLLPNLQARARLPMRVMISIHDTSDSILATVKNFYGLYDGPCVSLQDKYGNILIAAYENFEHNMTVLVKVAEALPVVASTEIPEPVYNSPRKLKLDPPIEMRAPLQYTNSIGRSRNTLQKGLEINTMIDRSSDQQSDSDSGNTSTTSSRRLNARAHASAEISFENIVEGGRRQKAKFESSQLPLFVPPQIPSAMSISSMSPQRRITGEAASPLPLQNHRGSMYSQALPSPQSYGRNEAQGSIAGSYVADIYNHNTPYQGIQLRSRPTPVYQPPRRSIGGVLPTPEPTVGSVVSDEDVALQLMKLGDTSMYSHGRTSTSTIDDALSGKADAASSDDESADEVEQRHVPTTMVDVESGEVQPRRKRPRLDMSRVHRGESTDSDQDTIRDGHSQSTTRSQTSRVSSAVPKSAVSTTSTRKSTKTKNIGSKSRLTKASTPAISNGTSLMHSPEVATVSLPLGSDEEDLSAKPRCQRCRKSKKGCDRQRPCQRCKDAGIGVDGCVSEDEGNGRRGRYGRFMGVASKKNSLESLQGSPLDHDNSFAVSVSSSQGGDSKKRKRSI